MRKRPLITLILFVLLLWAGAEVFLPTVIARQVEKGVSGMLTADQVKTKITGTSAVSMLRGRFNTIQVDATGAHFDKMSVGQVSAVFHNVELDMKQLLGTRTFQIRSVAGMDATFVFAPADLAAYLNQNVKGFRNIQVTTAPDKVKVTGALAAGPMAFNVTLDGRIVADGTKLKFVTEKFLLNNTVIAGNLAGSMLSEIALADFSRLPFPVTIHEIVTDEEHIVVRAGM